MTESLGTDAFESIYHWGVTAEDPAPATGSRRAVVADRSEPLALRGCVLGDGEVLDGGYVILGGDTTIAALQRQRPEGVRIRDTAGVILPGLIDLHGHPEFNVFTVWEPPALFANRYEWRSSPLYAQVVREPQNRLLRELPPRTQSRYAEIRALVGGVTSIQGASGRYPSKDEALVRNVDLSIFGAHRARAMIDLPVDDPDDLARLQSVLDAIARNDVDAFYLHLAEGHPDDAASRAEFDRLVALDALTSATVVIHGTALDRAQLATMADAGAALVWSPQSNLRLYGDTTRVADALSVGLRMALGADWLPSGSPSLLAELKVARRVLGRQGRPVAAQDLVAMVTSGAADIAGLADQLGTLAPGRPGDVVVLERRQEDPWENVVAADPSWVEMVFIDGDLSYGRSDWVDELAGPEKRNRLESVVAWGKPMSLDASYTAVPTGPPPPTLAQLRADLIASYPQVGPIFA